MNDIKPVDDSLLSKYNNMLSKSNISTSIEATPPDKSLDFVSDCQILDRECKSKGIYLLFCSPAYIDECDGIKRTDVINGDKFLSSNVSKYIEGDNIEKEIINVWIKIINSVSNNTIVLTTLIAYAPGVLTGTVKHKVWDNIDMSGVNHRLFNDVEDLNEFNNKETSYFKSNVMTNIHTKFRLRQRSTYRGMELNTTRNRVGYPGFMKLPKLDNNKIKKVEFVEDGYDCPSVLCPLNSTGVKSEVINAYNSWCHLVSGIPYDTVDQLLHYIPDTNEHIYIEGPQIDPNIVNETSVSAKLGGSPPVLISTWKNIISLMNVGSPLVICGTAASFPPSLLKKYRTEIVYNAYNQTMKIENFKKHRVSFAVMYDEKDIRQAQSWGCIVVPCSEKLNYLNNNVKTINKSLNKDDCVLFDNVKIQHSNIKSAISKELYSFNVPIFKPCPLLNLILDIKGKTKKEGPSPKGHQPSDYVDP